MSDMKAIVIRGDFTQAEFAELVALIRKIDDRRPTGYFEIVAVDSDSSALDIAEEMLRKAVPDLPGRDTKWTVIKRSS